jgi:hypothetical protein
MIYLLLSVCFLPYKNQTLILKTRNVTDFKNTSTGSDAVCNALLINLIPSYNIYIYLPLSRGILLTVIDCYNLQPIPRSCEINYRERKEKEKRSIGGSQTRIIT